VIKSFIVNIPSKHIVRFGRLLGKLLYVVDGPHRRVVHRNLQFTHPEWSAHYIQQSSQKVFQNFGIAILEIFQMSFYACDDYFGRIRLVGEEHLYRALEKNKGLIIFSAHLGNWEVGLQYLTCLLNLPITGVAKKIRFKPFDRLVNQSRSRFGVRIIDKKGAFSVMLQTLRRGEILALLIDQSKSSEGIVVKFFDKLVRTTPAVAMLAIRCKSPVLPMFCARAEDGQLTIFVEPPLDIQRTRDLRSDLTQNTQMMTNVVEKAVRKYSDQWLWLHKRWKKHYPLLYPEHFHRRRQRNEKKRQRLQS
jgi:KDO2-lipid IV(A) lauroyltransferase